MGPRTLETLRVELDDLAEQVEGFSKTPDVSLSVTQQAVIRFRIQLLQVMLDELRAEEDKPWRH